MNIIPFEQATNVVVSERSRRALAINKDVASVSSHGTISIKGKVFTMVRDNTRQVITRNIDGEDMPAQSLSLTVLRANLKARVYYEDAYDEESSAHARPTCYSHDGITPAADAQTPQCAKCQICPKAVWGSKSGDTEEGKGTACAPNARLAVAAPNTPNDPLLLRVPPASIKAFREAVKIGEARQLPYNQLVMRVAFDATAASPKLVFKPTGILDDGAYSAVDEMYENPLVKQIVGLGDEAPAAAPASDAPELDAALAARTPKAIAAPAPTPKAEPAPAPAAAPAPQFAEDISLTEVAHAVQVAETVAAKPKATRKPAAAAAPAAPAASSADDDIASMVSGLDALLGGIDD